MLLEDGDRKWLVEELEPGGGWGMPLVHGVRRLRLVVAHVECVSKRGRANGQHLACGVAWPFRPSNHRQRRPSLAVGAL